MYDLKSMPVVSPDLRQGQMPPASHRELAERDPSARRGIPTCVCRSGADSHT